MMNIKLPAGVSGSSDPMPEITRVPQTQWVIFMDACGTSFARYAATFSGWEFTGNFNRTVGLERNLIATKDGWSFID